MVEVPRLFAAHCLQNIRIFTIVVLIDRYWYC